MPAGSRFAENTVRAARLTGQPRTWWQRLCTPIPLAGLSAAAAVIAVAGIAIQHLPTHTLSPLVAISDDAFAGVQELAETEALSAAVDNLDNFTDTELVSLIGF